jgi:hypothetical protein
MTKLNLGYYAHHHGAGHVTRALAIAAHLPGPVTLFGSSLPVANVPRHVSPCRLPLDFDQDTVAQDIPGLLYAPLNVSGLRERMGVLVDWFRHAWPCLLVVDVSVEVALIARLCGVPTVYVRQRGTRFDPAHALAYASAQRLLAPYPRGFEQPDTPAIWIEKTDYTGLISRYDQIKPKAAALRKTVTVITGHGGTAMSLSQIAEAARACPEWDWAVIGPIEADQTMRAPLPANLQLHGIVGDPLHWLGHAGVVVGSAGDSLVSELADLQCRFICIPESRPFDEQLSTAQILQKLGLAICCQAWPAAESWPALLEQASGLNLAAWQPYTPPPRACHERPDLGPRPTRSPGEFDPWP